MAALFVLGSAAVSVFADIQVVDRVAQSSRDHSPAAPEPSSSANHVAELHYQLQVLQEELMNLRGQVDQQAHQLKQLKQQQLDNYLELDRRLGNRASEPVSSSTDEAIVGSGRVSDKDELDSYRSAIDMVLKQQDYEAARLALKDHLKRYPNGRYAANAHYWLGEIDMLMNELVSAQSWFSKLISLFPDHPKVPDAKFKLAKAHHLKGDNLKAKGLLDEVAASNSSAAALAKQYLKEHFPD